MAVESAAGRRDWERPTVTTLSRSQTRTTFRVNAPSPSAEILAKHDAELEDQLEPEEEGDDDVICF